MANNLLRGPYKDADRMLQQELLPPASGSFFNLYCQQSPAPPPDPTFTGIRRSNCATVQTAVAGQTTGGWSVLQQDHTFTRTNLGNLSTQRTDAAVPTLLDWPLVREDNTHTSTQQASHSTVNIAGAGQNPTGRPRVGRQQFSPVLQPTAHPYKQRLVSELHNTVEKPARSAHPKAQGQHSMFHRQELASELHGATDNFAVCALATRHPYVESTTYGQDMQQQVYMLEQQQFGLLQSSGANLPSQTTESGMLLINKQQPDLSIQQHLMLQPGHSYQPARRYHHITAPTLTTVGNEYGHRLQANGQDVCVTAVGLPLINLPAVQSVPTWSMLQASHQQPAGQLQHLMLVAPGRESLSEMPVCATQHRQHHQDVTLGLHNPSPVPTLSSLHELVAHNVQSVQQYSTGLHVPGHTMSKQSRPKPTHASPVLQSTSTALPAAPPASSHTVSTIPPFAWELSEVIKFLNRYAESEHEHDQQPSVSDKHETRLDGRLPTPAVSMQIAQQPNLIVQQSIQVLEQEKVCSSVQPSCQPQQQQQAHMQLRQRQQQQRQRRPQGPVHTLATPNFTSRSPKRKRLDVNLLAQEQDRAKRKRASTDNSSTPTTTLMTDDNLVSTIERQTEPSTCMCAATYAEQQVGTGMLLPVDAGGGHQVSIEPVDEIPAASTLFVDMSMRTSPALQSSTGRQLPSNHLPVPGVQHSSGRKSQRDGQLIKDRAAAKEQGSRRMRTKGQHLDAGVQPARRYCRPTTSVLPTPAPVTNNNNQATHNEHPNCSSKPKSARLTRSKTTGTVRRQQSAETASRQPTRLSPRFTRQAKDTTRMAKASTAVWTAEGTGTASDAGWSAVCASPFQVPCCGLPEAAHDNANASHQESKKQTTSVAWPARTTRSAAQAGQYQAAMPTPALAADRQPAAAPVQATRVPLNHSTAEVGRGVSTHATSQMQDAALLSRDVAVMPHECVAKAIERDAKAVTMHEDTAATIQERTAASCHEPATVHKVTDGVAAYTQAVAPVSAGARTLQATAASHRAVAACQHTTAAHDQVPAGHPTPADNHHTAYDALPTAAAPLSADGGLTAGAIVEPRHHTPDPATANRQAVVPAVEAARSSLGPAASYQAVNGSLPAAAGTHDTAAVSHNALDVGTTSDMLEPGNHVSGPLIATRQAVAPQSEAVRSHSAPFGTHRAVTGSYPITAATLATPADTPSLCAKHPPKFSRHISMRQAWVQALVPGALEISPFPVKLQLEMNGRLLHTVYDASICQFRKGPGAYWRIRGLAVPAVLKGAYHRGWKQHPGDPGVLVLIASKTDRSVVPLLGATSHGDTSHASTPAPSCTEDVTDHSMADQICIQNTSAILNGGAPSRQAESQEHGMEVNHGLEPAPYEEQRGHALNQAPISHPGVDQQAEQQACHAHTKASRQASVSATNQLRACDSSQPSRSLSHQDARPIVAEPAENHFNDHTLTRLTTHQDADQALPPNAGLPTHQHHADQSTHPNVDQSTQHANHSMQQHTNQPAEGPSTDAQTHDASICTQTKPAPLISTHIYIRRAWLQALLPTALHSSRSAVQIQIDMDGQLLDQVYHAFIRQNSTGSGVSWSVTGIPIKALLKGSYHRGWKQHPTIPDVLLIAVSRTDRSLLPMPVLHSAAETAGGCDGHFAADACLAAESSLTSSVSVSQELSEKDAVLDQQAANNAPADNLGQDSAGNLGHGANRTWHEAFGQMHEADEPLQDAEMALQNVDAMMEDIADGPLQDIDDTHMHNAADSPSLNGHQSVHANEEVHAVDEPTGQDVSHSLVSSRPRSASPAPRQPEATAGSPSQHVLDALPSDLVSTPPACNEAVAAGSASQAVAADVVAVAGSPTAVASGLLSPVLDASCAHILAAPVLGGCQENNLDQLSEGWHAGDERAATAGAATDIVLVQERVESEAEVVVGQAAVLAASDHIGVQEAAASALHSSPSDLVVASIEQLSTEQLLQVLLKRVQSEEGAFALVSAALHTSEETTAAPQPALAVPRPAQVHSAAVPPAAQLDPSALPSAVQPESVVVPSTAQPDRTAMLCAVQPDTAAVLHAEHPGPDAVPSLAPAGAPCAVQSEVVAGSHVPQADPAAVQYAAQPTPAAVHMCSPPAAVGVAAVSCEPSPDPDAVQSSQPLPEVHAAADSTLKQVHQAPLPLPSSCGMHTNSQVGSSASCGQLPAAACQLPSMQHQQNSPRAVLCHPYLQPSTPHSPPRACCHRIPWAGFDPPRGLMFTAIRCKQCGQHDYITPKHKVTHFPAIYPVINCDLEGPCILPPPCADLTDNEAAHLHSGSVEVRYLRPADLLDAVFVSPMHAKQHPPVYHPLDLPPGQPILEPMQFSTHRPYLQLQHPGAPRAPSTPGPMPLPNAPRAIKSYPTIGWNKASLFPQEALHLWWPDTFTQPLLDDALQPSLGSCNQPGASYPRVHPWMWMEVDGKLRDPALYPALRMDVSMSLLTGRVRTSGLPQDVYAECLAGCEPVGWRFINSQELVLLVKTPNSQAYGDLVDVAMMFDEPPSESNPEHEASEGSTDDEQCQDPALQPQPVSCRAGKRERAEGTALATSAKKRCRPAPEKPGRGTEAGGSHAGVALHSARRARTAGGAVTVGGASNLVASAERQR